MSNHHGINAHGFNIFGRIDKTFAFAHAGTADGKVNGIRPKSFGGQTKTGFRPGRGLEKQVDYDLALEVVPLDVRLAFQLHEFASQVENGFQFRYGQIFQAQQMGAGPSKKFVFRNGKFGVHGILPDRIQEISKVESNRLKVKDTVFGPLEPRGYAIIF